MAKIIPKGLQKALFEHEITSTPFRHKLYTKFSFKIEEFHLRTPILVVGDITIKAKYKD